MPSTHATGQHALPMRKQVQGARHRLSSAAKSRNLTLFQRCSPLSDLGRPRGVRKITPLAVACCGACASATAARNTPDRGCGGCNTRKGKKPALYAGSPRRCEQILIRLPAGLAVDCGKEVVRTQLPDGGQARPPKGSGTTSPPAMLARARARERRGTGAAAAPLGTEHWSGHRLI